MKRTTILSNVVVLSLTSAACDFIADFSPREFGAGGAPNGGKANGGETSSTTAGTNSTTIGGAGGAGGSASGGLSALGGSAGAGATTTSFGGTAGVGNSDSGGAGGGTTGGTTGGGTSGTSSGGATSAGGTANGGATSTGGTGGATTTGGTAGRGGASTGGAAGKGGAATGGVTSTGGTATGGMSNTGGTTATLPAGWWTSWKTEGWHGCPWAFFDTQTGVTTTVNPMDFRTVVNGGPYRLSGSVGANYEAHATLGFNLAQSATGASCAYDATLASRSFPGVTIPTAPAGIAFNFAKTGAFTLRIMIQGPEGNSDPNQRWCQTITAVNGQAFASFDKFNTKCWVTENPLSSEPPGLAFTKASPIAAISFMVVGSAAAATPFDFTVYGFALGTTAADAPGSGPSAPMTGMLGGAGNTSLDFQRVKVAKSGEEYIIQNNNFGNPTGTDQSLSFSDNSFKITAATGSSPGGGVPAAYPSIYIGNNGNTANGMTTRTTDNLPRQVSSISAITSTFTWTGTCGSGFDASYDMWFASTPPSSAYSDAVSGAVMVWLCKPSDHQPIGAVQRTVTIAGQSWDVWVGPRGGSGANSNAPVVSFVKRGSALNTFTGNLMDFVTNAATNGIQTSWYLTDVFAGFEIWNGPSTLNLGVSEFTCVVQ